MVFLAPPPPPLGFFLPLPLGLLLSTQPMLLGLHCILKLTTHIHHHLDHFHFITTSCMRLLPMNIGPLYSSIWLATDCPQELVSSCSQNMGQTSILLWHRLCIPSHYLSQRNTIFYIYHFHLSLIHYWIQIQVTQSSSSHFHNSKPTLVMNSFYVHHAFFSLYTIIEDVCVYFVFIIF